MSSQGPDQSLLGPERPEGLDLFCGYDPRPQDPDGPAPCLADAVWHGLVMSRDHTALIALLSTCDRHRPLMMLTATHAHEMGSACGLDEAEIWWNAEGSGCRINWDGGAADALRAAQPASSSVGG